MSGAVTLNVVASGDPDGPPLVLLHGVGNSHRTFGFLTGHDAVAGLRVLRPDLRGHGSSPRTPGHYRLRTHVADVVAVLESTGPAVVVGHSLGGVVGWALAQSRPDLVTAALLEDPPLFYGEPDEHSADPAVPVLSLLRERCVRWRTDGADVATVAAELAGAPAGPGREDVTEGDLRFRDAIEARARGMLECDLGVFDAVVAGTTLGDVDTATSPRGPVRVLAADETLGGVLPARHAERLVADHPTVSLRRVTGSGHGIHDEKQYRDTWISEVAALV